MTQRRIIIWAILLVVAYAASAVLSSRLAAQDPISEVLLGRAGFVLPLIAVVLMLRLVLVILVPAILARAVAKMILDWRSRNTD